MLTKNEVQKIKEMVKSGYAVTTISYTLGHSLATIYKYAYVEIEERRKNKKRKRKNKKRKRGGIPLTLQIVSDLIHSGLTYENIGNQYGVTRQYVGLIKKWCVEVNIPLGKRWK